MAEAIDDTAYPVFTTKQEFLKELVHRAEESGDFYDLAMRLNNSDTTGWADGATVTKLDLIRGA